MIKVLFVCMGNICRSPTAEGIFKHHVKQNNLSDRIAIDSAGTHAYHVGQPPDERASEAAMMRGFDLSDQRARRVEREDFEHFDYVLAMDRDNLDILSQLCPQNHSDKLSLFLEFAPGVKQTDVPDPYYGGGKGFETVINLVEQASTGLLEHIRQQHGL